MGNVLLVISLLIVLGMFNLTSSAMPGGDYGMGYGLMLFFYAVGFTVFSGLLVLNLGYNDKFAWIDLSSRNWIIFLAWLAFAIAVFCMEIFRSEWHPGEFPNFLGWLARSSVAVLWLPVLVLVPCFWLINAENGNIAQPLFVQLPLKAGIALSLLISLSAVYGLIRASAQQTVSIQQYNQQRNSDFKQQQLAFIASQTDTNSIVNILSSSGRFNDPELRNASIEKIKSHPNWEGDLIYVLNETEFQAEAYHFIDGNQVDHPELFIQPIKISLQHTADQIRNSIIGSNNLQDWHMEHMAIDRILRAIDEQFAAVPGADFLPEVRAIRDALNTPRPERFKEVKFTTSAGVEKWLKSHNE
ncbi:MAG: hypothetical protein IPL65_20615 [Lewinellaceae bacterium]|nr:hypothetical protein [Lewinellaceae bacterium]